MIILGIDPGIAIVGYGIIEYKDNKFKVIDYGAITTPAHTNILSRLETIYKGINILKFRLIAVSFLSLKK